jgi:outer membrane protein TolC
MHRIRGIAMRRLCITVTIIFTVVVSHAADGSEKVRAASDGPQPLDAATDFHSPDPRLTELIEDLLSDNPEILAAHEYSLSHRERVAQQSSLPDPQLSYRLFLSTPETRVGPQRQGAEFSQALPGFGKRKFQAQRAGHVATATSWRTQELERALVAELKRAYFDAAYLQEALAINSDEAALLRRFEQISLTRYSTGEGIQQSVIKVQTDVTRLADQRTALQQRLDAVERRIAELAGRPTAELMLAPISLSLPELPQDTTALAREAIERNPGIFATQQQIEADSAWIKRRKRDSYPDFALALGYVDVRRREDPAGIANPPQDNGKDIWSLGVKLSIPLYRGRVKAGVAEAERSLGSSRQELRRKTDRITYEVRESLLRAESFDERARLYRDLLIPQAEESLASAEAAYTTNRQSFLDLLDAQRVLFQVRLTYHRLLSDYWISLADLERTIARPFPGQPVQISWVDGPTKEEGMP